MGILELYMRHKGPNGNFEVLNLNKVIGMPEFENI